MWEKLWTTQLNHNIKDIKFGPKSNMALIVAVGMEKGLIQFYAPSSLTSLKEWNEVCSQVQTTNKDVGGCECIAWGTAFDEQAMIAVGCREAEDSLSEGKSLI
jgi:hypothetical protein